MWLEDILNDVSKKYDKDISIVKKDFTREMAVITKLYPYAQINYRFRLGLFILDRLYSEIKRP